MPYKDHDVQLAYLRRYHAQHLGRGAVVVPGAVTMPALSQETLRRLAPTIAEERRLRAWLDAVSGSERRMFWAAVLVLDGQASMRAVLDGRERLDGVSLAPPVPAPPAPVEVVPEEPSCRLCGAVLPRPSARGGRQAQYCAEPCRGLVDVALLGVRRWRAKHGIDRETAGCPTR